MYFLFRVNSCSVLGQLQLTEDCFMCDNFTNFTLRSLSLFEQLPLPLATDMETPHPMLVTRISQLPLVMDGARASNGLGLLPISSTTITNESPFPLGLSLLLSRGTSTKPLIPSRYHISRSQTLHDLSHPHTCSLVL